MTPGIVMLQECTSTVGTTNIIYDDEAVLHSHSKVVENEAQEHVLTVTDGHIRNDDASSPMKPNSSIRGSRIHTRGQFKSIRKLEEINGQQAGHSN